MTSTCSWCLSSSKTTWMPGVELTTIVWNDRPWNLEPANNVFPYKILYLCFCDCCKSFCFHPFREVVNRNEQEFHLSFSLWQGTHNVDSPLCERLGWGNGRHLFTWNSLNVPVSLATIALLYELCCVLLHREPEIARPHDLPDQWLFPHVISADPSVYLFQDVFGLFPLYAS